MEGPIDELLIKQVHTLFNRVRKIELLLAFVAGAQIINIGSLIITFIK